MLSRAYSRGWLAAAITISLALILGAPYIGQLRAALRDAVGGDNNFTALMVAVVGGAAVVAIVAGLVRIRDRRAPRYAALVAALCVATAYSLAARTGNPAVDAVERFHFIEYGIITVLFYGAWRPAGDGSMVIMPLLAGLAVGTLEEWLQWFVPARVGEARDVLLNFFAIGCGLLFSYGVDPPPRPLRRLSPATRRVVTRMSVAVLLLFALFFYSVHLELAGLASERSNRWRQSPPLTWSRFSQEDQYFSEGVAHARRRNESWQAGNIQAARHENLILEKYYAPVLDTPSYVSPQGLRWPSEQRATAHASTGPGFMIYVSDGNDYPIFTWPPWIFWAAVATAAVVILRL
jgi:VanZ family protein